jgi:uncharacterized protein YecT (DUF1311 family)
MMSALRTCLVSLSLVAALAGRADALEATFAGRWRVVEASPAPWARGPTTPALARSGVVLLEDRVLALQPLGCGAARYEVALSPPEGLFQGALGNRAEAAATAIGLSGDVTTLRLSCDTGVFDFHHRGGTDLLFALDNVIYTLRRPDDPFVPPEDAAFVAPIDASFPCAAARSTAEQLICSNERTARADAALGRAYRRLSAELSPANLAALRQAQRSWLAFVHAFCRVDGAMPEQDSARNEAARCLGEESEDQATFYEGLRVASSGGIRIEPRVRIRADLGRQLVHVEALPELTGPAARVGGLRALVGRLARPAPHDAEGGPRRITRDYVVHRLDARLLSLSVTTRIETGTRVPPEVAGINWDLRRNRPLDLATIFQPDVDWAGVVLAALESDAEPHVPDTAREAALREMRDVSRWAFGDGGVSIRFSTVAMPSVAEPQIEIPASAIAPLLRDDSPWRPAARR